MKKPNADLRSHYVLFVETGLIFALLFVIAAVKVDMQSEPQTSSFFIPDKETVVVDIPPTRENKIPPKPQKPMIFEEKPNDEVIEDEMPEFTDFDEFEPYLDLPPKMEDSEDEIMDAVEIMPELKGGLKKLYAEIEYPKQAIASGTEGLVQVEFIVDENGKVANPKITRGIGAGCDQEVLRVIKLMKFSPGVQNGRLVKVRMSLPVHFRLQH